MSEVTGILEEKIPLPPDVQADFYLSSMRQIIPYTFPIANYSQEETQIKGQRHLTVSLYLQNEGGGGIELKFRTALNLKT